jgi:hypothetical protein
LVTLLIAAFCACERRPVGRTGDEPGTVVAKVDGHPLYQRDLESYLPETERSEVTAEDRSASFNRWLATQLLYDEAQRSGLQISRDIDWKLEQYRRDLVADRLLQDVLNQRAVVTRSEVMAYYKAHHDEFNLEVRVSHILTNKHTGAGGDLGYLSRGNMPVEFEKVVFKMHVGEVSKIVESEFGYHILKLTDVRPSLNELPFESVSQEISRELLLHKRAAVYDSLITSLRSSAKVDVVDPDSLARARAADDSTATRGFTQAVPEPRMPALSDSAAVDTTGGE